MVTDRNPEATLLLLPPSLFVSGRFAAFFFQTAADGPPSCFGRRGMKASGRLAVRNEPQR
jgi:hypothetical protein